MRVLCEWIAVEKDRDKFTELVDQLNKLLEQKEHRLQRDTDPPSTPENSK